MSGSSVRVEILPGVTLMKPAEAHPFIGSSGSMQLANVVTVIKRTLHLTRYLAYSTSKFRMWGSEGKVMGLSRAKQALRAVTMCHLVMDGDRLTFGASGRAP